MMSLDYLLTEMRERRLGFAAHYLLLYSVVRGLNARRVVEFGAGMSTRVILDALAPSGSLWSCSTETRREIAERHGFDRDHPCWVHLHGLSKDTRAGLRGSHVDLILHDGAHDRETVIDDLREVLPALRRFGLVLIHDTQHEHCGPGMRLAARVIAEEFGLSHVTLPYGYGLTIMRRETGDQPVDGRAFDKINGRFRTLPSTLGDA